MYFSVATVVRFSGSRRVYNTGVSTFIIGERLLMRVEGQLVVAHGMCVCACVRAFVCVYVYVYVCVCMCLYVSLCVHAWIDTELPDTSRYPADISRDKICFYLTCQNVLSL